VPIHPAPLQVAIRLRRIIARLSRLLRQTHSGVGLTPTQLAVLGTVARSGPLRLVKLAEIEGINPTMLSRIVAKLARAGLITRGPDPADGRAALLAPTVKGRRLYRQIQFERNDLLGQLVRELSESERQLLIDAIPTLEALTESLQHLDL